MGEVDRTSPSQPLSLAERMKTEAKLREMGWSYQRIAEKVGVSKSQVRRDLSGLQHTGPEKAAGKDGKVYPARRKKEPESQVLSQNKDQTAAQPLQKRDDETPRAPGHDQADTSRDIKSVVETADTQPIEIVRLQNAETNRDSGVTLERPHSSAKVASTDRPGIHGKDWVTRRQLLAGVLALLLFGSVLGVAALSEVISKTILSTAETKDPCSTPGFCAQGQEDAVRSPRGVEDPPARNDRAAAANAMATKSFDDSRSGYSNTLTSRASETAKEQGQPASNLSSRRTEDKADGDEIYVVPPDEDSHEPEETRDETDGSNLDGNNGDDSDETEETDETDSDETEENPEETESRETEETPDESGGSNLDGTNGDDSDETDRTSLEQYRQE